VVVLLLSEYSSGLLSFSKEVALVISLTQVLTWIVIAAVVGFVGELPVGRVRSPPTTASLVLVLLIAFVVPSHVEVTSHFAPRGGIHFDITPYVVNSTKQTSTTPSDEGMRDDSS
jgi:hypothetical protein